MYRRACPSCAFEAEQRVETRRRGLAAGRSRVYLRDPSAWLLPPGNAAPSGEESETVNI